MMNHNDSRSQGIVGVVDREGATDGGLFELDVPKSFPNDNVRGASVGSGDGGPAN